MQLNKKLIDFRGNPVLGTENDEELNILDLCISALITANVQEDKGKITNMGRRYIIASRLSAFKDDEKDIPDDTLTNRDKTILMACLATLYNPMVVGRVAEIIDPALLKDD